MHYSFSSRDYVILALSYVFLGISAFHGRAADVLPLIGAVPAWVFLLVGVLLNLWCIPLPGIHPRISGRAAQQALPAPQAAAPDAAVQERVAVEAEPVPVPPPSAPRAEEKLGRGLAKTHKGFIDRIAAVFRRSPKLDASILAELEETLVGTDIGVRTAYALFEAVQGKMQSLEGPDAAMEAIRQEVESILAARENPLLIPEGVKPFVIMVTGVNGSGKTTTIAKMAYRFKNEGKSVLIASGDTFRAAAIEQLEHWAVKVGADFVKAQQGADPSSVAFDGLQAALARGHDVLIIDTAGRLHTKENLMEELKKTKRVLSKKLEGAPHEILLVLDATIGQNAIEQTRQFNSAIGVTGIAMTKLDGSSKGGVIVGIANEFDIPIRFVGIGEDMDDLQPFDAKRFVEALFLDND